jgi:hypothetical protein
MDQVIANARRLLSSRFATPFVLHPVHRWEGHKSIVFRCRVQGPGASLPASVVVKQSKQGAILEDWAACQFLQQIPHDPPFAPECYGGDLGSQMVVLEDLGGDGPNTHDLLLAHDPAKATAALLEHIRLMGQLHAATIGQRETYNRIRTALGPILPPKPLYKDPWSMPRGDPMTEHDRGQAIQDYRSACFLVGLTPSGAVAEEIERVTARVEADPGPFLAFCQGDVNTPDNCLRWNGRLRLLDFDSSGFRHALVEGLAGRLTWGCMSRIPGQVVREMDRAYREELATRCIAAGKDQVYRQALVEAAARWHIFHVVWRLPTAWERDYLRGLTTLRQQLLAWLDAFVEIVSAFGVTTALGASAQALAHRLRQEWSPEEVELPYYPAFRGAPNHAGG